MVWVALCYTVTMLQFAQCTGWFYSIPCSIMLPFEKSSTFEENPQSSIKILDIYVGLYYCYQDTTLFLYTLSSPLQTPQLYQPTQKGFTTMKSYYTILSFKQFKPLETCLVDIIQLPSTLQSSMVHRAKASMRFLEYERSSSLYPDHKIEDWFQDTDPSFLKHPALIELYNLVPGRPLVGVANYEVFKISSNGKLADPAKVSLIAQMMKILTIEDLHKRHRDSMRRVRVQNSY